MQIAIDSKETKLIMSVIKSYRDTTRTNQRTDGQVDNTICNKEKNECSLVSVTRYTLERDGDV